MRTTSATSGPFGSAVTAPEPLPCTSVTSGTACSSGDGNAPVSASSSSASPTPVVAHTGMTGWKEPRATAVSRSAMSVSCSISSPSR